MKYLTLGLVSGMVLCLGATGAAAMESAAESLFTQITTGAQTGASTEPQSPREPQKPRDTREPAEPTLPNGAGEYQSTASTHTTGPACGDIRFVKYECQSGVTVERSIHGPGHMGAHTVPAGCRPERDVRFGYIHQPQIAFGDVRGPFPGLDDETRFTPFTSRTNSHGKLVVGSLTDPSGRYILAELDAQGNRVPDDSVLGFFCTDDSGSGSDNYALTFLEETGTDYCIVYNGTDIPSGGGDGGGTGTTTPPSDGGGNGGGGNGGGGPCTNCGGGGGGGGDDDDDDSGSPTIELERNIAGLADLPGVPKTGSAPMGSYLHTFIAACIERVTAVWNFAAHF
jgi:hypothetical protein